MRKGIFGPISGRLGPVVGGVWKGIAYLRGAPKKKIKSAPRSQLQIENEQKMKFMNEVLVPFHPFINIGFQNLAKAKTAISAAYSANYYTAITGVYPNLGVDYSRLVLALGNLPGLNSSQASLSAPDTLQLNWIANQGNKAVYNDQLMLVVYSPQLGISDGFVGAALRRDLQCSFKFDPRLVGMQLEVYVSLTSFDRKKIANSIYLGRIDPL
ncbi:DUF6266 family protein [Pedobacter foliorum]|uniref:DUF6266 family protein n=1 Tax=Pedobacter foliorum TaxID=2739058 RepID=UPI001567C000|nr:DUF6266 family protein [Pedobacter foliorum]NRF39540.1 hypothetical protein [Pedobacter foliorum]